MSRFSRAGICSTLITLIWTIVNYILGHAHGKIIGITHGGGEMKQTLGFGIVLTQFFPLREKDDPVETQIVIEISPILFVISVIGLWIILYVMFLFIDKIKGKKATTENV